MVQGPPRAANAKIDIKNKFRLAAGLVDAPIRSGVHRERGKSTQQVFDCEEMAGSPLSCMNSTLGFACRAASRRLLQAVCFSLPSRCSRIDKPISIDGDKQGKQAEAIPFLLRRWLRNSSAGNRVDRTRRAP